MMGRPTFEHAGNLLQQYAQCCAKHKDKDKPCPEQLRACKTIIGKKRPIIWEEVNLRWEGFPLALSHAIY